MPVKRFRLDRPIVAAIHDVIMAALSFVLALYLRLGDDFWNQTSGFLIEGTLLFTAISAAVFSWMRLYRGVWRYASVNDLIALTKAATLAILVFMPAMFLLTRLELLPRSTPIINWFVLLALLGGPRLLYRLIRDGNFGGFRTPGSDRRVPALLVGASDAAEQFIREMDRAKAAYRVVGLIDDDPANIGRNIRGVRVLGDLDSVERAVEKLDRRGKRPQRLLLADDELSGPAVRDLLAKAEKLGLTMARLPRLTDFRSGEGDGMEVRPIAVEHLLGRPQTVLDRDSMRALITGRRVLVTGAGGTIGGELSRQVAAYAPAEITLLDNGEHNLYRIDMELAESAPDCPRHAILGDIRDRAALAATFRDSRPEIVFHAAALKHVPMVETNLIEGAVTNAVGTRNVADAAREHGALAMVMISTDKAVNPTNVMGATKRIAEQYCQALDLEAARSGGTRYLTVRFGNVLGSTGSVVPLFERQLRARRPLTVTHPEATRYFMTVREAVELVLQASAKALDTDTTFGGIYVLDMGEPIRIADLAAQMIRLAGLRPNIDIPIDFVGLRPGEKLHEELFHESEPMVATRHAGIRLAKPRPAELDLLSRRLDALATACAARHLDEARRLIAGLVPEFRSTAAIAAAQ
ncbi:MAG: nucleotide sugar dehydratase [Rhodospirillaceae bacterium]|nr:nucleotide sugar dehydratase [Rhodospirillaceae bacterium]